MSQLKGKFEGNPEYKRHPVKADYFVITKGFRFYLSESIYFEAKPGDQVNGATVPILLQGIFKRFDPRYARATDMHDILVGEGGQDKGYIIDGDTKRVLTWRESAKWFKMGMEAEGSGFWLRNMYNQAVMLKKRPKQLLRRIRDAFRVWKR